MCQNTFGGRAPPGPADGELKRFPDPIAATRGLLLMGGGEGRVQREREGRLEREGKRREGKEGKAGKGLHRLNRAANCLRPALVLVFILRRSILVLVLNVTLSILVLPLLYWSHLWCFCCSDILINNL